MLKEYPKISHLDLRKIFTREFMIYSSWGKTSSRYPHILCPNRNIMVSLKGTQNELEVRICFHCHTSSSLLHYLPLTAFFKLASTF